MICLTAVSNVGQVSESVKKQRGKFIDMYNLFELLEGIEYRLSKYRNEKIYVTGVVHDSREVLPGNIFICLKGKKRDGFSFIREAEKRGVRVIICENTYNYTLKNAVFVTVKDARKAYSKILSNMYGNPAGKLKMVAVTGTNGKTTVCQMIASGLNAAGKKCAVIGTLGAEFEGRKTDTETLTTPDPELLYKLLKEYSDCGAEYVVMEASSHSIQLGKLECINFVCGAITNLTPEHLDFHGNMDEYYRAKKKLFEKCLTGVFLTDDQYTEKMYGESECKEKIRCSVRNSGADYYCSEIECSLANGCRAVVDHSGRKITYLSPVPAEFTASNILLAAAVLDVLGIDPEDAVRGIAGLKNVPGRMEKISADRNFDVYIDFAHTPDALEKLLSSISHLKKKGQRVVTLFGCGGDRDKSKRQLMGKVASMLSDFVIITSDNSRTEKISDIIKEIEKGVDKSKPYLVIENREKAIEYAISSAADGDIIMLCGKGHENYEIDSKGKHEFSEKEIVSRLLKNRK